MYREIVAQVVRYTGLMVFGVLIMLFVIAVMVIFFILFSGSVADMWDTVKDVFQYQQTRAMLWAGILLVLLIVVGGGVVRYGLTVKDVFSWI